MQQAQEEMLQQQQAAYARQQQQQQQQQQAAMQQVPYPSLPLSLPPSLAPTFDFDSNTRLEQHATAKRHRQTCAAAHGTCLLTACSVGAARQAGHV